MDLKDLDDVLEFDESNLKLNSIPQLFDFQLVGTHQVKLTVFDEKGKESFGFFAAAFI